MPNKKTTAVKKKTATKTGTKTKTAAKKSPAKPKKTAPTASKTTTKKKVTMPKKTTTTKQATKANKKTTAKRTTPKRAKPKAQKVEPYQVKANEDYMNESQLEHFQKLLEDWRQQLIDDMSRTVEHMQQDAANFPDPVDRASQEEEFSLELRTRDRERKLIRKIDEALERIKSGDYGFCLDCGADIGIRRLEARPTATQCIECKTISEIREKQTGTSGFDEL